MSAIDPGTSLKDARAKFNLKVPPQVPDSAIYSQDPPYNPDTHSVKTFGPWHYVVKRPMIEVAKPEKKINDFFRCPNKSCGVDGELVTVGRVRDVPGGEEKVVCRHCKVEWITAVSKIIV